MDTPTPIHPFAAVRMRLTEMQHTLEGPSVDLMAFAKAYANLASAVLLDVQRAGQSSIRFEAVCKALDLRTTKTELQTFVGKDRA